MADTLGRITVPDLQDSGQVFPIVPDWGYGYAQAPHVVVHQFGSGNAKIEQRFYLGTSAKRFTIRRARLTAPERVALRDFYEAHTPYKSFSYRCPSDDGKSTTTYKVRFAEEPLSFSDLSDYISSTGVTLIEVPTTSPVYTLSATVTRFPSAALATALLDQAQEIIPLVKISPRESGYPAIYVSDRRCTVGTQLYVPRLLDFDGISQGISGESDQASFTFGNADRAMRDLANDTNLLRAGVEFSLFHVGTGIKLDLWKGEVVSWDMDAGPEFRLSCADGIYELTLPYPCRRISRTCWKSYNDAAGCPYATQSTGMDMTHFPTASVLWCDKSYDGANGCLAHGMKKYFGGIIAEPQTFLTRKFKTGPMFTKSLIADGIYESVLPEIYCFNPSYKDENNDTKYGMPVQCKLAAVREELDFFSGLGIVGEGPITFGVGHTLDGIYHHGQGTGNPSNGLRTVTGTEPAGAMDYFSLDEIGNTTSVWWKPDWRKVYEPTPNKTYKDNFSAGTAFLTIRRNDDAGVQLSKVADHSMEAIVKYGLQGWWWSAPGTRHWYYQTNPVWIAVNMLLRAKGARYASVDVQETYFDVDAAIAAAAICSTTVDKVIGTGTEVQFRYQGVVADERPLRDWITDVLMNCNGYYTWSFGKLKIGIRSNSSAVEAFTDGNILFRSLNLAPLRPSFNYLTGQFKDQEFRFQDNNVSVYDEDHAKLVGGSTAPLYLKAQIPLSGTSTKSQAARIVTTRLREELGGITAAQWRDARELSFRTTILSLAVEPGMVCSMTHADMPSGAGEFRVTGWRLNKDYSIDISGRTTVDEMYDMTVGPKPADVEADPVPVETPVVESPFDRVYAGLNSDGTCADDSVTEDSIADGAVTEPKIGTGAVTEPKIDTAAVTEAKLADLAVTAAKLAAGAVDITKCASSIRPPEIFDVLPAPGNKGRIVFLTSDNKLYRDTGTGWTVEVSTVDLVGTITSDQISDGAVGIAKFAAGISAPEILNSLPAPGNKGRLVFLTTDNKLYRDTGTAWTVEVSTLDLVGTISSAQIADGSIGLTKFASGIKPPRVLSAFPVSPENGDMVYLTVAAGDNYPANVLYSWNGSTWVTSARATDIIGSLVAGQIAAGAIGVDQLAANAVTAAKLASNSVTADKIEANAVTSAKIAANAISSGHISADSIIAGKIAAGAVSTSELAAKAVTTSKLAVIPDNICPDPYLVGDFWSPEDPWTRYAYAAGNPADLLGVPNCVELTGAGTSRRHVWGTSRPFSGEGQALRLRAKCNNTSNQYCHVTARFRRNDGGYIDATLHFAPGSGVTSLSKQVTVPNNTSNVVFIIYNDAGTTLTGAITVSEVKLDVAASADLIVDGAVTAPKIAASAVETDKLAANAVTSGKIAANSITSSHILANSIISGKIAAGAVGANEIAAKAITVNKLAVLPYNHNPDPLFLDESAWSLMGAWQIVVRGTGNVPDLMQLPRALVLDSSVWSGTANVSYGGPRIAAAGVEQTLRLCASLYNNSNWGVRVGLYYYSQGGGYLGESSLTLDANSGLEWMSRLCTVPANTASIGISGYALTDGTAFSGQVAVSNIRVDLAGTTDLIVDGAITANKIGAGQVTATKISVSNLSSLSANIGTVTAGTITGATFRTMADANGNYMELAGTKMQAKDVDGNVIWELLPNLGPMSVTDDDVSTYEVEINTSTCANEANMGGWSGSVNNPPNTPDGMAQAIAAAKAMYASGTITGKWEITELFATTPRSLLVSVNATTSSSTSARVRVGPITFKPTWQSVPGDPNAGYWTVDFMPAKSAIMTGFPANLTDTRIVIVPVLKLSNKLFIQRSYLFNLPATGTIRILGIFS